jgi:hypothetical protein
LQYPCGTGPAHADSDIVISDLGNGEGDSNTEGGGQQARARKWQLRTRLVRHMQHLLVRREQDLGCDSVGLLDQHSAMLTTSYIPHATALTPFPLSCDPREKSRSLPTRRALECHDPEQSNVSLHHTDRQRYRLISRRNLASAQPSRCGSTTSRPQHPSHLPDIPPSP